MKAVVVRRFGPIDAAEYGDLPDPQPGEGELVVDLAASDVNYPDIPYFEGRYQASPPFPFSPGLGGAGRVSARGKGVTGFKIGQKVLVLPEYGTYAEKVRVPVQHCFAVPEDMPFATAAALGLVYQTAYFALIERGRFRTGDTVLVLGATGGIGMAAIQLARAMGAGRIVAATRGDTGAALARGFGADNIVDAAMDDVRDGLRDAVHAATGGAGVDIVIDPVGGDLGAAALRTLAWCGRLVVVGFASGDIPKIGTNYLLIKNISISGLQWTDYRARHPVWVAGAQQRIFDLWSAGRLKPEIAGTLLLAAYAEALKQVVAARVDGKIILTTGTALE